MYIICLIGFVLSIILLILFGVKKKSLYWNLFFGIIISRIISTYPLIIYISLDDSFSLGDGLALLALLIITIVNSVILLIIGLIVKSKIKKNNPNVIVKTNKFFPITMLVYVLICLLFIVLIPKMQKDNTNDLISNSVLSFLETKYGDNSFKIKEIENDYSYNGFVSSTHIGYEVYVTSSLIDGDFEIDTDLHGNVKAESSWNFSFLSKYFYKKYGYKYNNSSGKFESSDSPLQLSIDISSYRIPNNYGKMPTFDEIISYNAVEKFYIYLPDDKVNNYKDDIDTRISYVGKETADLIKKFNINKPMEFDFIGIGLFRYNIKNVGNYLIITGDDDFTDSDKTSSTYKYDIKSGEIIKNENILY